MFNRVLNHLCINYFHKAVAYLFTKIDQNIPPYIKHYSIVDSQIHVTLSLAYLFLITKIIVVLPNHVFLNTMH